MIYKPLTFSARAESLVEPPKHACFGIVMTENIFQLFSGFVRWKCSLVFFTPLAVAPTICLYLKYQNCLHEMHVVDLARRVRCFPWARRHVFDVPDAAPTQKPNYVGLSSGLISTQRHVCRSATSAHPDGPNTRNQPAWPRTPRQARTPRSASGGAHPRYA